jgi:organic hydroperoxide reductase OsmC/OhrA
MLTYLSLCARRGIRVLAYEDHATGTLALDAEGGGRFTEIRIAPEVRIATGADADLALRLHDAAHEGCFIARSCSAPIHHHATIVVSAT